MGGQDRVMTSVGHRVASGGRVEQAREALFTYCELKRGIARRRWLGEDFAGLVLMNRGT